MYTLRKPTFNNNTISCTDVNIRVALPSFKIPQSPCINYIKKPEPIWKSLKKVNVYVKPSRRKNTKFSKNQFPTKICSNPHWYSLVISYPGMINIPFSPCIYIELQTKDGVQIVKEGIKAKKQSYKDSKKRAEKKVRNEINEPSDRITQIYLLQFTNKSFKCEVSKKFAKLKIVEENSGIKIFESNPFKLFSRKQKEEELYWLNLSSLKKTSPISSPSNKRKRLDDFGRSIKQRKLF